MRPDRKTDPLAGKVLGLVLLALLVLGLCGTILLQYEKQPEQSPVSRGAKLVESAGCFACHGRSEDDKRFNLRPKADAWAPKANPTFWEDGHATYDELIDWITHGVPAAKAERHKKLFIRMPAYEHRLKPEEIEAIAAWVLAEVPKYGPKTEARAKPGAPASSLTQSDQLLVSGDRLSRKFGCYQCHGELGQGGVPNLQSFKRYIPGFFGDDFRQLTAHGDRTEILHWIDHGRGVAVEQGLLGRLARHYFDTQAIPMPGYRDQLTPAEKELLTDYLLLLNKSGPLPAKEIERITTLIDHQAAPVSPTKP